MKYFFDGFKALADGFASIFGAWDHKPRTVIKRPNKINLKKILGRDFSDPKSDEKALQGDARKIRKDWEKVLGKSNRARNL
jgi:hypothetical protein